jgi:hypothetical protein
MLTLLPPLVANGVIFGPALVLIAGFFACVFMSRYLVGWFRQPANAFREGEEATIAEAAVGDVLHRDLTGSRSHP